MKQRPDYFQGACVRTLRCLATWSHGSSCSLSPERVPGALVQVGPQKQRVQPSGDLIPDLLCLTVLQSGVMHIAQSESTRNLARAVICVFVCKPWLPLVCAASVVGYPIAYATVCVEAIAHFAAALSHTNFITMTYVHIPNS